MIAKMPPRQYRKPHRGDKTILSRYRNGNSLPRSEFPTMIQDGEGKMVSMFTLRFLIFRIVFHMFEADGFPVEIGVNHTETFFESH